MAGTRCEWITKADAAKAVLGLPAGADMDNVVTHHVGRFDVHDEGRWAPSTDIASAWAVLEFMLANYGGHFSTTAGGWDAHFGDAPPAFAPTAPLAICRAAVVYFNHETTP